MSNRLMERWAAVVTVIVGLAAYGFPASHAVSEEARRPGEAFRDCPDCAELVVIHSGAYDMGSNAKPAEQPIHHVAIKAPFAIGRRLVTFAEWDKCVAAGGCKYSPPDAGSGPEDRPVTNVSWDDAKEFTAWLSRSTGKAYRLPTEAEWELAARAGTTTPYWWGADVGTGNAQCAECGDKAAGKPAPVASFRANAFGLYDTSGDAAEWVEDCWNPSYRGAPMDGSAWTSGDCSLRVLRGGSFSDKAAALRSAARFRYDHDVRYYANGFRVARDLAPSELQVAAAPAPAAPAAAAPIAPAAAPTAPGAPATPVPFEDALRKAANDLFTKANLEGAPDKVTLVIDPLIDGASGARTNATLSEEKQIVKLVKENYPRFEVAPFEADSIAKSPVVLIGTFTAINNAGAPTGPRDAYRICLALADLARGKIISKGVARALPEGVDPTPTPFFADSPVYLKDPATDAYIRSCQGSKPGDPVSPVYADRILVAALVSQAIEAYDAKRYGDALDLYRSALQLPGGEQLRVLTGIYLANEALRRRSDAADAFGRLVDFGLKGDKLAVKFLFQPGSTIFLSDPKLRGQYESWLSAIAQRTVSTRSCLEIVGHTSATGIPAVNDELSVLRAQYVKDRLETDSSVLHDRLIASGKGSRELIVGTGRDDASDSLDRRVELNVMKCGG
jgi:formylglycine-generating enzyme required for sulfatase activity/outer membrane protein OmpA-like peptidoglycan-associated protein